MNSSMIKIKIYKNKISSIFMNTIKNNTKYTNTCVG